MRFSSISPKQYPSTFERLVAEFPVGLQKRTSEYGTDSFKIQLLASDHRVQRVRDVLESEGFRPGTFGAIFKRKKHIYAMGCRPVYSLSDIDNAEHLRLISDNSLDDDPIHGSRNYDPNNPIMVEVKSARRNREDLALHCPTGKNELALSNAARRKLESVAIPEIEFYPTEPVEAERHDPVNPHAADPWQGVCDPWWELGTKIELPPLPKFVPLAQQAFDYKPVTNRGTDRTNRALFHPVVNQPPLRYTREQLNAMPPFDIANTFEWFQVKASRRNAAFVITQNFRQKLLKLGISANYEPVLISEDGTDPFRPEDFPYLPEPEAIGRI